MVGQNNLLSHFIVFKSVFSAYRANKTQDKLVDFKISGLRRPAIKSIVSRRDLIAQQQCSIEQQSIIIYTVLPRGRLGFGCKSGVPHKFWEFSQFCNGKYKVYHFSLNTIQYKRIIRNFVFQFKTKLNQ